MDFDPADGEQWIARAQLIRSDGSMTCVMSTADIMRINQEEDEDLCCRIGVFIDTLLELPESNFWDYWNGMILI